MVEKVLTKGMWDNAVGWGEPEKQDQLPLTPAPRKVAKPQEGPLPHISLKSPPMEPCELERVGCGACMPKIINEEKIEKPQP